MICVSIGHTGFQAALSLARRSEMIEIRQDLAGFTLEELSALIAAARRSIFTCRPGGFTDEQRLELFSFALEEGASYADVEMESDPAFTPEIRRMASRFNRDLIISYHNFELTPGQAELGDILKGCYSSGADVAKIATMVKTDDDIALLLGFTGRRDER